MYKVLIVDDDTIIREGLSNIINWEEYDLEIDKVAENGVDACDFLKFNQIDIMITDIRMPEMDGIELIEWVNINCPDVKNIVLSGYSDFQYVKEAARLGIENYILKPVDERELINTLIATVKKIEKEMNRKTFEAEGFNVLRSNILYRWVRGDIDEYEIREKAPFIGLELHAKEYILVMIVQRGSKTKNTNLLQWVNKYIEFNCPKENKPISFMNYDGTIVIIFYGDNISIKKEDPEKLIGYINKNSEVNVFISVSDKVTNHKDISKCYADAKRLQNYSLIKGKNKSIFQSEVEKSMNNSRNEYDMDFSALNNAVKNKNIIEVNSFIEKSFEIIKAHNNVNPSTMQDAAVNILYNILTTVKSNNVYSNNIMESCSISLIDVYQFSDIDEMKYYLCETSSKLLNRVVEEDEKLSVIVKRAKDYIDNNYIKDIKLKNISHDFNMNAYYLGQLFKDGTGESFNNYLNKYRINKAKELLTSGFVKVNGVAEKVGYVNTNYFYTIFKKTVGVSPATYRGKK